MFNTCYDLLVASGRASGQNCTNAPEKYLSLEWEHAHVKRHFLPSILDTEMVYKVMGVESVSAAVDTADRLAYTMAGHMCLSWRKFS